MATVRGMTPEAIRALLKKELGDYQALNVAVNSAKGASESAIAEVENIRNDIKNMDFDFDDSKLNEAMEKFDKDMEELNQSLDEVKTEALARENKLTALEKSLNQDRDNFNKEMRDMAKELSESKSDLDQQLAEAAEKLAANVTEVGERFSREFEQVNKTLSESLAKDLAKLNNDLTEAFGKDLKSLETRQNSKTDSLDKELKNYKSNTDSKMGTLLSEIDKAKAFADGFLQPGNLVWNPMALDNARYITTNNDSVKIESEVSSARKVGALKTTKIRTSATYIDYGASQKSTFELNKGDVIVVSAWIFSSVELPPNAIGLKVGYVVSYYNPNKIPANRWVRVSGEVEYAGNTDLAAYFSVLIDEPTPRNAVVWISEPHAKKKVTSDLIVDGAVTSKSIATGAVTAGKIAADSVTANNIAADSIGARHIVAKSIGADQLAANAVTADKIAANAVDADKIKAKSIGADQLAANAVTTDKLDANAVTADKINAGAVTAQKLAAGAVTADKIAANSIDATKMTISPGNLFPDPHFKDPCWGDSGQVYAHKNNGGELRFYPQNAQIGKYYQPSGMYDTGLMLEGNSAYRITANVYANPSTQPGAKIDMYMRYANTSGRNSLAMIGSIPATSGVSTESVIFTTPDDMQSPQGTIGFFINKPWNGGQITMWNVYLTRAADASLIVKGGVQADHIAANQITSKHISVDSIDGDRIKSNTLDADKIKANSLTSDHVTFKNGFIKNAMIGDGQITNAKIKDLNADKINAGTMHGDRIQAGTLDANRIKAGTLDAKQIATGTLDANRIAADSITVNQLRAGTIVPIGGSLIHSEPKVSGGVPQPIWWEVCDTELAENYRGYPRPDGNPWRMCSKAQSQQYIMAPPKRLVKIKPGQKYRLTFWCRSTIENTKMFIEMRDQNGAHAVKSGAVYGTVNTGNYQTASKAKEAWDVTDFSESKVGSYLVSGLTLPTKITKVTSTIEFKDNVEYVYLDRFYLNHGSGINQGNQWIAGLSLELEIPDQKAIDAKQDATLDRLDKDADFLNDVLLNVARMLVRAEQNKTDSDFVYKGFIGTLLYGMFGIKVTTSHVELFVTPDWVGKIFFIANCSVGAFHGTPATWMTKTNSNAFKLYNASYAPSSPPSNFEHKGQFKYLKIDVRPAGVGSLDQVMLLIQHLPSFDEMFRLLTTKKITRDGMLEYGRPSGTPEPPMKERPSWERRGRLSSF